MNWEAYAWIAWLVAFGILESIGLFKHNSMTLTYFVEQHIPKWVLASLLGWMTYHFLIAGWAKR